MAYMTLENYYRINFSLLQFQKWPIPMIEDWTPMDRELYVHMLSAHIEDEKMKQAQNQNK
jgi:hypothetical protein